MKVPSTTGTKTNVPRNPALLIATLAAWRVRMSAERRQAKVSAAALHLLIEREEKG